MDQQSPDRIVSREDAIGPEARLSWLLSWLAGMIGAVAFLHSAGYFVTFMTGNTERAVLGWFRVTKSQDIAGAGPLAALSLMASFILGVFVASVLRRKYWAKQNHPHGAVALATAGLLLAAVFEFVRDGWDFREVDYDGILMVCFAVGALNTSFVKRGEVAVPLSYVTGTIVKLGQGLERHLVGEGTIFDWVGYLALLSSFMVGAAVGGMLAERITGAQLIGTVGLICGATTIVTFFHSDRRHRAPESAV